MKRYSIVPGCSSYTSTYKYVGCGMGGGQQHKRLFGDTVWTPGVGLLNIFGFWQFFVYYFQDFKNLTGIFI